MKIIGAHVNKADARDVSKKVKRCIRQLRLKQYELDMPADAGTTALHYLRVRSTPGIRSRAGASNITINLECWQRNNRFWTEYKRFNNDPTIGSIRISDADDALWCLVAHEVSHHVQYRYCPRVARFSARSNKPYMKPHGYCFQDIYRYLRRDLINPMIQNKFVSLDMNPII